MLRKFTFLMVLLPLCLQAQSDYTRSFDYLIMVDQDEGEPMKTPYATTIRFNVSGTKDVIIYMEEDPPVRFHQISKMISGTENGESFQLVRLKVSNKNSNADLYLFEGGNIMLRNHSNNRVLLFTNNN